MKKSELQLNIISAEKKLFSGAVTSVVIPGVSGSFGVYPDHAPLISPLKEGVITYIADKVESSLDVKGGIAEVNDGVVTVCVI
ncbi:F-type H+-transporting ATPase subunit epsilon [Dysgonomonas sp. PFB1-18]|uniref:ATP synthase F1 subunit epsilon n=1 Tax=unclassified Dysgonomonas TaxID=2630389 RepID=UPI00247374F0|nr:MULTISPECIES: ATP synthase F1 subunit epsilon [unclassified Dysgonomonas]MDH6308532.1 F-type H+-transporting ATPase subunit epsilon [Dysgonomonas sp. PF1-14]MDH6338033.1 F-type H+-transporting ATPase subunit epsilon [Dysgonomonas sp. PF1-16]MDH6379530.1 F-type H+-transporting ATPase subunit epsilon [Dysgonomonas sp. PFB1-18]MDH6396860.1 F-type H+-transporting ATPase subunit epsilon [Dysgonomonas sp. PF1-23]